MHLSLNLHKKNAPIIYINSLDKWHEYKNVFLSAGYIIDGLFGTGMNGNVKGIYSDIINDINHDFTGPVLSIDVPSGLICDCVKQYETIIKAHKTYTVGLPKLGMFDFPGKNYTGHIETVKIGFPDELLNSRAIKTHILDKSAVLSVKPQRKRDSNKGDFGHVLVIAGSEKYPGAAHLTAIGAKNGGAGLVTLCSTINVCRELKSKENEIITLPLKEIFTENYFGFIDKQNFEEIKTYLTDYSCAVIGPGMGQIKSTQTFMLDFFNNFDKHVVVDADALNFISKNIKAFQKIKNPERFIFTPHIGEFSRLSGKTVSEIKENKVNIAMSFAKKFGIILVLKDSVTLITNGQTAYFNTTGNSGLARAGSGDVLAGLIGAMLARGLKPYQAALFSVYLHGLCADIIAEEKGVEGVFPEEILNSLYKGFLAL